MNPSAEITRQDLYQKIWTIPFVRVARDLGYSYPELVKICRQLNLPRPTAGYWHRLAHGGASEQVPLPPATAEMLTHIAFGPKKFTALSVPAGEVEAKALAFLAPSSEVSAGALPHEPGPPAEKIAASVNSSKSEALSPSNWEPIRLTREQLYENVWKKSLTGLAKELGTTYVDLVRACDELNVPRPDKTYWSRLQFNMPVDVVPLPTQEPGALTECMIRRKGAARKKVIPETGSIEGNVTAVTGSAAQGITPKSEIPESPQATQTESPRIVEYNREQLYEEIWKTPCQKLAGKLGISDVALAKTCRRLGVPRPPRGYWAKVEVGERPKKPRLPAPKPGQDREVCFDVLQNLASQKQRSANILLTAGKSKRPVPLDLSEEGVEFHPVVERHRRVLEKSKQGDLGYVSIHGRDLFVCDVTVATVPKLLRAMDAIVGELDDRDYDFEPSQSEFRGLQIARGQDRVELRWSEDKLQIEREPTDADKRRPSWTWQLSESKSSGVLSVEVSATGLRGKRKWTEGEEKSLEEVLGIVLEKVEATFKGFEDQRLREAEWEKQEEEERKREAEQEAKAAEEEAREEQKKRERERLLRHQKKLEEIAEQRRDNLREAAQLWIETEGIEAFIQVCEIRWKKQGNGKLSTAQTEWLDWARSEVLRIHPWTTGYPDPLIDGKLTPRDVPVGGPYPKAREFEANPLKEELQPPAPQVKPTHVEYPGRPEQFPFWLLHPRH